MLTRAEPDTRNVALAVAIARDGRPKYLIAAEARIPANVLGGILSGRVQPTAAVKQRLANALSCYVEELFQ